MALGFVILLLVGTAGTGKGRVAVLADAGEGGQD